MSDQPCQSWFDLDTCVTPAVMSLQGHWRLVHCAAIWQALTSQALPSSLIIRGGSLDSLDSAGSLMLLRRLSQAGIAPEQVLWQDFADEHARIIEGVRQGTANMAAETSEPRAGVLERIGKRVTAATGLWTGHLNFLGATLAAFASLLRHPGQLRIKELTVQFDNVCLSAIPVVALVTMLIGVTIAYLLGLQAEQYGANIFVVDGVGIGMMREFSPIIVATIVAGRSGAAFTAHLGAMRLTEEIDAIRTLGLSPMQVLVIPRVLALVLALPLLVFLGDAMGIIGAMLVADPLLGLTPATIINRVQSAVDISHLWVGLVKAPVFALFIALIGCRMGMTVSRDTRAVGMATTSTVVQSIVSVILLDAAFAIVLQELGI